MLYCAYSQGVRAGLLCALGSVVYLAYFARAFELSPVTPRRELWEVGEFALFFLSSAYLVGVLHDRHRRSLYRERMAASARTAAEERTHRLLESLGDGFVTLDRQGCFTYLNRAAEGILRHPREELLGRPARRGFPRAAFVEFLRRFGDQVSRDLPVRFESLGPDESWYEVHVYPSPEGLALHLRDVTERRQHEEKLRSMTLIDELTGLYNRRGFFALAGQHAKLAERKRRGLLLVFADLDNLKQINDTHGHTAGDQALFEVAAVLRHTFRETDVVARIGGDEFAALVLETDPATAPSLVQRLHSNLEQANAEGTLPVALSLSVGLAASRADDPRPIDELLTQADHRMYEQKRTRRR